MGAVFIAVKQNARLQGIIVILKRFNDNLELLLDSMMRFSPFLPGIDPSARGVKPFPSKGKPAHEELDDQATHTG
jgi:hypothetical protein